MSAAQFNAFVDSLPHDAAGFHDALAGLSDADQAAFHARILADAQGSEVDYDSYAGAVARGAAQGSLNLVNGVQDSVIGILNLPAMGVNGIAWAEEKLGILPEDSIRAPYIPSPDWSKDWIVPEGQFAHDASKFLGAAGAETLAGVAFTKFLKPLLTKVDDAAQGGKTVLGSYPDYLNLADGLGAKRFSIPQEIWDKMSDAERWAANQKFLDRMIARGDEVILSNSALKPPLTPTFAKEIEYLISKGFRISDDGFSMLPPGK